MNQEEKSLVREILRKTKLGEIQYTPNKEGDRFTAEINGLVITIWTKHARESRPITNRHGYVEHIWYNLDIKNGENTASFIEHAATFLQSPVEKLWYLLRENWEKKEEAERDSRHSRLVSEFTALLR